MQLLQLYEREAKWYILGAYEGFLFNASAASKVRTFAVDQLARNCATDLLEGH